MVKITYQNQPNPAIRPDGPPCNINLIQLTGSDKLIYVVALGYKACENTKLMLALNELAFDQYDYHLRYIGSVTEAWINSRAMSWYE